jgi:DnaJ-class molecular chaperone
MANWDHTCTRCGGSGNDPTDTAKECGLCEGNGGYNDEAPPSPPKARVREKNKARPGGARPPKDKRKKK